jgi:hypothetical protein
VTKEKSFIRLTPERFGESFGDDFGESLCSGVCLGDLDEYRFRLMFRVLFPFPASASLSVIVRSFVV